MAADGRRPQGTGSVYQRGDGKWVAQIDVGWTEHGRRRYARHTCRTKQAAQVELKKMISDRDAGTTGIDPRITVKSWCDQWLTGCEHRLKPHSIASYTSSTRKWIVPVLGRRQLASLTTADLDKLTRTILNSGDGDTTAHSVAVHLRVCLKAAVVAGHQIPAAVLAAPLPRKGINRRGAIPLADASRILATAAHRETWPPLPPRPANPSRVEERRWHGEIAARHTDVSRWMAALLQGVRQGEALGLTWDCVDLDADILDVSWQLQSVPPGAPTPPDYELRRLVGAKCLVRPKSRAGLRTLPIVPWMAAALAAWKEEQGDSPHGLVWPASTGNPMNASDDLSAWHALLRIAGVQKPDGSHYVLHEGRHTTASLLSQLEIPVPVIIAIVGHSSYATTMKYTHVGLEQARAALQQVADRLQITA